MGMARETVDLLKAMAVFEAVARLGGFTAAASALGLSKQTVSDLVGALERRMEVRLLNRSSRSVTLTDAGRRILPHCREVAAQGEAALAELRDAAGQPRGPLVVATSRTFGTTVLAPIVFDYLARYPETRIDLRLEDRAFDIVTEGIDLAFQAVPPSSQSVVVRRIGPARSVRVASPAWCRRHGDDPEAGPWIEWRQAGAPPGAPLPRLRVPSASVAVAAAVAGLGATKAPEILAAPHLRAGRLLEVSGQADRATGHFLAIHGGRDGLPARVRLLLDMVIARMAETG